MLRSELFAADQLLEAIAADRDRISRLQHPTDPAVGKVQTALLFWDPSCLPVNGANGTYGYETASAVDAIGVPADLVIDDVGPQTVLRLDAMLPAAAAAQAIDPRVRDALRAVLADASSPSVAPLSSELARRGITPTPDALASVLARLLAP